MNHIHNYQWFSHKHTCLDFELMHLCKDMHLAPTYNNNNVGLHTFVHGEKLNFKITLEVKGTKLGTSRNVGK
jgi:hypothetical protein